MKRLCVVFLLCSAALFAKEFGKRAETWPIEETDLSEWIQQQLEGREPEVQAMFEESLEEVKHPPALEWIGKANETRRWTHDLSIALEDGSLLNPLDQVSVQDILFFDATDPAQLAWAKKQGPDALWCLIKGHPFELQEQEGREAFYDQLGFYTGTFKIEHVPAKVSQQGTQLLIEEVAVDEQGNPT